MKQGLALKNNFIRLISGFTSRHRLIILSLSAIVVFVTTYILILPAITLDAETAEEMGGIDVASEEEITGTIKVEKEVKLSDGVEAGDINTTAYFALWDTKSKKYLEKKGETWVEKVEISGGKAGKAASFEKVPEGEYSIWELKKSGKDYEELKSGSDTMNDEGIYIIAVSSSHNGSSGNQVTISENNTDDKIKVTNTYSPAAELRTFSAVKVWEQEKNKTNDFRNNPPEKAWAIFELYRNGEGTGKTIKLDGHADGDGEKESWKATFENLPVTDADGNKISYSIKETDFGYDHDDDYNYLQFSQIKDSTDTDNGQIVNGAVYGYILIHKQFECQPNLTSQQYSAKIGNLKFKITGPHGYEKTVTFAGGNANFDTENDLNKEDFFVPAGDYTVEEIGHEGLFTDYGYVWNDERSWVESNAQVGDTKKVYGNEGDMRIGVKVTRANSSRAYFMNYYDKGNGEVTPGGGDEKKDDGGSGKITVTGRWTDENGNPVSAEGRSTTVQLKRYHYVEAEGEGIEKSEPHKVKVTFVFPSGWTSWGYLENPTLVVEDTVNSSNAVITWNNWGGTFSNASAGKLEKDGGTWSLKLSDITGDQDITIECHDLWTYNQFTPVITEGELDVKLALVKDDAFNTSNTSTTKTISGEGTVSWKIGDDSGCDFPGSDDKGDFLYYVVEIDENGNEVQIGNPVSVGVILRSIEYGEPLREDKGIKEGVVTVTNQVSENQEEEEKHTRVTIEKYDKKDLDDPAASTLKGAAFKIVKYTDSDYRVIDDSWESGEKADDQEQGTGTFEFDDLTDGYYTIEETQVPLGYIKISEDPKFEVKDDGDSLKVIFSDTEMVQFNSDSNTFRVGNEAGQALPNTGGRGTHRMYLLGTLLLITGGVLLTVRRRMRT